MTSRKPLTTAPYKEIRVGDKWYHVVNHSEKSGPKYKPVLNENWTVDLNEAEEPGHLILSISRNPNSLGYESGLFEMALLENWHLAAFPDGDVVKGYLSESDVVRWIGILGK